MRRYQKATTVLLLLAFLVTLGPGRLQAGVPPISRRAAVQVLQSSGIVDAKAESDLRLDDPITRAEMAKILASAIGAKAEADTRKNQSAFADTTGHWANGWIAVAQDRGFFKGRPDGRFHPDDRVTYAEVLTALLRLTGRSEDAARDWPWGAITSAAALGMVPTDIPIANIYDLPATRGDVFRLTATALGRVPMNGSDQTVLQKYLDRTPPSLQLTNFPRVAGTSTVTVSGKAVGAITVFVKDQVVEPDSTGTFMTTLTLLPGRNRISVIAVDGAGNQAEATTDITYETTDGAFTDPQTIPVTAGTTFPAPAVYLHTMSGRSTLADGIEWRYDPSVLTYDSATNQFKALTPGEYSLVAKVQGQQATAKVVVAGPATQLDLSIDRPTLAAGSAPATVTIRALDAEGRFSPGTTGSISVAVTPQGAATLDSGSVTLKNGVGTLFLAPGPTPMGAGLTVKAGGKTSLTAPLLPFSIEAPQVTGIRLEITPNNLNPQSQFPVTINAVAVDQSGAPIPVATDLGISLFSSDDSILSITADPVIKAGTASSAFGGQAGSAVIGGAIGSATIDGVTHGSGGMAVSVIPATVTASDGDALDHLVAKVAQGVSLADGLSADIITITRVDNKGQVAVTDKTPVTLVASSTSLIINQLSDVGGAVTFAVRATQAGRYTVTAGIPGRPELNTAPLDVGFVAVTKGPKAVVKTSSTSVAPADSLTAYVALQGTDGGAVPNPGPAIRYRLTSNSGRLSKTEVLIPTGATRSETVTVYAPLSGTGLNLVATPQGGKSLSPVQITVTKPTGTAATPPKGVNLIAIAPPPTQPTLSGDLTRIVVQARDGANLRTGSSYAFDLKVKLDGKDVTTPPDSLSITIGERSVFGTTLRTLDTGEAEIWVQYTGTGHLEVIPVARDMSGSAYNQYGEIGYGASTKSNSVIAAAVDYKPAPLDRLKTVISPQVGSSSVSVIRTGRGRTTTIRIAPTDLYGNTAGEGCVATLSQGSARTDALLLRSGAGYLPQQSISVGRDGYAEFTVMSMSDEDASATWYPSVVCGSQTLVADPVTVFATSAPTLKPTIVAAGGNVSTGAYVYSNQDAVLRITLKQELAAPPASEVFVYDGVTLIGRYGPVDLTRSDVASRSVNIPLSAMSLNYSRYITLRVRLNVAGDMGDPSDYTSVYYVYVPPSSN